MKKHSLLVVPMIAFLAMAVFASASNAKDDRGTASGSPVMRKAVSQPSDCPREFTGRWHHRHPLEAMMKKLGITDVQKKQIRNLYVGFRDRTRKTRMELRSLKDEKKTMLLSGKIDQQKLAQLDDQTAKLVGELVKEKLKLRRDRLALLTPEQLDKIADWQAEKAFRKMMKRQHWGRKHGAMRRGEFRG